jgi:hypothetical protein
MRFLFTSQICFTQAARMLSCTDMIANFFCNAKEWMSENSELGEEFQIIDLGILPLFRKKGANPVDSDLAELIANCIAGS